MPKTIAVISDPQIDFIKSGVNEENKEYKVLCESIRNMDVDLIVVCGDITENALPEEWDCFFNTYKESCRGAALFLVPGNMDNVYNPKGRKVFFDAYERCLGQNIKDLYFVHEADNFIMIGISPEQQSESTVSDMQLAVIDNAVKKATNRCIPTLVFSHYQLSNTIHVDWKYASLGDESYKIRSILEAYGGKVVFFSGHIHRGLISKPGGSVITHKNVTYVSTPSISKPDIEHYKADNDDVGTGYIVDIGDDKIRIRGYDFLYKKWLEAFEWWI